MNIRRLFLLGLAALSAAGIACAQQVVEATQAQTDAGVVGAPFYVSPRRLAATTEAVHGPTSATDNAIARFDGTTGKLLQNSVLTIADTTGAMAGWTAGNGLTFQGGGTLTGNAGSIDGVIPASSSVTFKGPVSFGPGGILLGGPTFTIISADTNNLAGSIQMSVSNGASSGTPDGNANNVGLFINSQLNQSATAGWADIYVLRSEQAIGSGTQNFINFAVGATTQYSLSRTGTINTYKTVTTAGWGVPAIYAASNVSGQTSRSAAIATYTVGAADGSFEVGGSVNVTASATHSFSLDVVYTDDGNVSRTLILPMAQLAGAFVTGGLITNVTGAGPYESPTMNIRCKASTSITIRPSAGTFTSVTYNAAAHIKQVQ